MQVFTPYANPVKTAKCLDNRRLAKQILECCQILSANTGIDIGWKIPKYVYNHPNTLLWKNDWQYLLLYTLYILQQYKIRKKKIHKCRKILDLFIDDALKSGYLYYQNLKHLTPEFCKKHQDILLQKDYNHYSKYF